MYKLFKILLITMLLPAATYASDNLGMLNASQDFLDKLSFGKQGKEIVSEDDQPKRSFAPRTLSGGVYNVIANKSHLKKVQFDTRRSIAIPNKDVVGFVYNYLDNHFSDFKIRSSDLSSKPTYQGYLTPLIFSISFGRNVDQIPVKTAFVEFNFFKDPSSDKLILREILNQSYGEISIQNPNETEVSNRDIEKITGVSGVEVETKKSLVVPRLVDGKLVFYKSTQFVFSTSSNGERYHLIVSDGSKEILEAAPLKYQARSIIRARVLKRNYLDSDDTVDIALPKVDVTVGGNTSTTDADGGFDRELPFEAIIRLKNNRVDVTPQNSRQTVRVRTTITDDAVQLSGDDFTAMNAFTAINRVNQFVRRFIDLSETGYLTGGIRLRINVTEDTCNAYYSGEISMFRDGGGCANMSRVNDVVYHEWGHGLDDYTGRNIGIQDGAFSEGIGDIVSAYMTDSPNMGAGFFTNREQGIRNLDNNRRYPQDQGGVHDEGRIIGGTFWDLREALIERYGEVKGHYKASYLFLRHLLVTDSYLESFDQVVNLDDDDGNPATKSPNFCLIVDAFKKHGLSREPSCNDVVEKGLPVDNSIFIGIKNIEGEDRLVASVDAADSMFVCRSDDYDCDKNGQQIKMNIEGKTSSKLFFVSDKPFSFSNHLMISVVIKDKAGSVIGVKRFKAVGR